MDTKLLELLVCPVTKGPLLLDRYRTLGEMFFHEDQALARKRNLRADMTKFFDGLAKERGLAGGLMEALRLGRA